MTASSTFVMLAPGMTPLWSFHDRNGANIAADANGVLSGLTFAQMKDAQGAGCTLFTYSQVPPRPTYTVDTSTASETLPVADITDSLDQTLAFTGTLGGAGALTLPAVSVIAAAIPGAVAQGAVFRLRIMNKSAGAYAWTVTVDTGATWTLNGTMAISQNNWRDFIVTIAAGGLTGSFQEIGGSTVV